MELNQECNSARIFMQGQRALSSGEDSDMVVLKFSGGTKAGRQYVGRLVKAGRVLRSWNLKEFQQQLTRLRYHDEDGQIVPYETSTSTLNLFERGGVRELLLLEAITALELIYHPQENHPLTYEEIRGLQREVFEQTGEWKLER